MRFAAEADVGADSAQVLRREAVAAYDEVFETHPESYLVADALYAKGVVLLASADTIGARQAFGVVVEEHGQSNLGCLSRLELTRLQRDHRGRLPASDYRRL